MEIVNTCPSSAAPPTRRSAPRSSTPQVNLPCLQGIIVNSIPEFVESYLNCDSTYSSMKHNPLKKAQPLKLQCTSCTYLVFFSKISQTFLIADKSWCDQLLFMVAFDDNIFLAFLDNMCCFCTHLVVFSKKQPHLQISHKMCLVTNLGGI